MWENSYKYRVVTWLPGNALTCLCCTALLESKCKGHFFSHLYQRSFWLVSSLQQPIFSVALVINKVTWSIKERSKYHHWLTGLIILGCNGGDCLHAPSLPMKCFIRILQFSHRVPFTKEKMPRCPCPFKNEAYRPGLTLQLVMVTCRASGI